MAEVKLFKKVGKYNDKKDGKEKTYVNFYVRCGDSLIPVEPCFFPDPKNDNKDFGYSGRKEVLKAFAETLPELPDSGKKETPAETTPDSAPTSPKQDNNGLPF